MARTGRSMGSSGGERDPQRAARTAHDPSGFLSTRAHPAGGTEEGHEGRSGRRRAGMPRGPAPAASRARADRPRAGAAPGATAPTGGRAAIGCACAAAEERGAEGRRAVAVDPDIKARNLARLRRIEGQVRGLHRMIEADRYCADILVQMSSVQEALRAVGRELMRNHLKHCAARAIRAGSDEAERMYDELVDLFYKHSR